MESDKEGKSLSIDITKNEETLGYYLKSANDINPDIKNDIGWCYEYGIGIAKDENKAYEWYFKAAMENSFCGQNNLGWCFEKGIGVVKNERKAFQWYLESAKGGNSSGQNNLGRCYEIAIGVDKDEKEAFNWYLKSANCGNPSGQYNLGICYRNGTGTSPNEEKAIEWLQNSRNNDYKCQDGYKIDPNVDGFLKEIMLKNSLSWIPFNELKNIQKVHTDLVITIYSAEWTYPHNSGVRIRKIRLNLLTGSVNADSHEILLNMLNAYSIAGRKKPTFLQCYGVSRDETTGHYIVIIQDGLANSLERNLSSVARMGWKEKLNLLLYIARDLQLIHSCNISNCGLYKMDLLQNNLTSAYIALCSLLLPIDKALTTKPKLIGSIVCGAPEVLNGGLLTKASDIYSFGLIMWEISSGRSMSDYYHEHYDNEVQFYLAVFNGVRPNIVENTVQSYSELMKRCWDNDPKKRPSATKICNILTNWKNNMEKFYELESVNYNESGEDKYKFYDQDYELSSFNRQSSFSITSPMGSNIQTEESISGNWLEKAISRGHINDIDYNKFTDPMVIGIGGFGKVFKYEWKDCGLTVALKCLKVDTSIDEKIIKDFIDELKLLRRVSCHPNVIAFYGVTKDDNENYNMILEYAIEGTLREYLATNFKILRWTDKLRIAKEKALGLLFLHDNDIIHRDLHSKNILIHQGQPKITDFGLSKQMNEMSMTSNSIVHGMPAYIEPQCLIKRGYKRDKRSDIYSFGQILWEISSGRPPFSSFESRDLIVIHVFQGNREEPIEGTPSQYIELYKKCWDSDPGIRPEARVIFNTLTQIFPDETMSQHYPIETLFENNENFLNNQDNKGTYEIITSPLYLSSTINSNASVQDSSILLNKVVDK